ncbi:hypothetical protein Rsub_01038 [Raphidocelis subcapitata]|uniref:Uncharacterized protein n=1 Tax=Raphidocelis subcapitata TaxID=307507 RepID=A0A2V0NLM2_9CHLO|nr:hypothetical protein Rsub_01038 [Raphidocelis subcapitata]|eukprot:GBF88326.1 hypothetical protein Rsub_01038 [Raphidocelis subcapitata]
MQAGVSCPRGARAAGSQPGGVRSSSSTGRSGAAASAARRRSGAAARTPPPRNRPRSTGVRADAGAAAAAHVEVRICTGKVCKKQGSEQIVRFGEQLGLPNLEVRACGCLGNCGNGPNLVLLPQAQVLRHVATPADLAEALRAFCGADVGDELLRATELRLAGNALAMAGDLRGAVERYRAALSAAPNGAGAHLIHANLSATHLQLGEKDAALEHARAAVASAPRGFHKAHVRLVDALYALGRYGEAEAAVEAAVASDASFAALPEYKVIRQALKGVKRPA